MIVFLTKVFVFLLLATTVVIPGAVASLLLWDFYYADQAVNMIERTFKTKDYEG